MFALSLARSGACVQHGHWGGIAGVARIIDAASKVFHCACPRGTALVDNSNVYLELKVEEGISERQHLRRRCVLRIYFFVPGKHVCMQVHMYACACRCPCI